MVFFILFLKFIMLPFIYTFRKNICIYYVLRVKSWFTLVEFGHTYLCYECNI